MSVVTMQKFLFCGLESDRDRILKVLQKKGQLHLAEETSENTRFSAPEFAEGAVVKVALVPPKAEKGKPAPTVPTQVAVSFPAAETRAKCRVFEYEVQAVVVEDDVELVAATRRVIAPDFHLPVSKAGRPGECVFALAELPKGVHLRFDVRSIECFGKKGRPIRSNGGFVA